MELTLPAPTPIRWQPLAALVPLILGSVFLIALGWTQDDWTSGDLMDADGYRLAAERLVAGESIYADPTPDRTRADYRHAPWLAWIWVGLNAMPGGMLLWRIATTLGAVYIIVSLARLGGPAGLVLAATALPLLGSIPHSNVGTLMVALLMWRRADPWSVGIAASLKIYPILLCAGYVAERRWRDVAIACSVAAVLWLPAVWSGIGDWPPLPGTRGIFPMEWTPVVALLAAVPVAFLAWRGSRWTWVAIGAAIPIGIPHGVGIQYLWVAAKRLTNPPTR